MGADSKIQWCHHTLNWWMGCQRVSEGCRHCYAEVSTPVRVQRSRGLELWGPKGTRKRTTITAAEVRRWNAAARAAGERHRVFAQSLADTFEDRPELAPLRVELLALVEECESLDFLLLTKRPENMVRLAPASWAKRWPRNAWAGTTTEDQESAEKRIPHLLRVPAAVRFLSVEPLLGSIDLDLPRCETHDRDALSVDPQEGEFCGDCAADGFSGELSFGHWLDGCADEAQAGINWVIVGGESGPGARPCDLAWIRSIVAQCVGAGVPAFVKQFGAVPISDSDDDRRHCGSMNLPHPFMLRLRDKKGGDIAEWPEGLQVRQFPDVSAAP